MAESESYKMVVTQPCHYLMNAVLCSIMSLFVESGRLIKELKRSRLVFHDAAD